MMHKKGVDKEGRVEGGIVYREHIKYRDSRMVGAVHCPSIELVSKEYICLKK